MTAVMAFKTSAYVVGHINKRKCLRALRSVAVCAELSQPFLMTSYINPRVAFLRQCHPGSCIAAVRDVRVRSHTHECKSEYPYTGSKNTSLHVFQWRPFTLIRVLYEYGLPVNFTRKRSFCAGRVFYPTHMK